MKEMIGKKNYLPQLSQPGWNQRRYPTETQSWNFLSLLNAKYLQSKIFLKEISPPFAHRFRRKRNLFSHFKRDIKGWARLTPGGRNEPLHSKNVGTTLPLESFLYSFKNNEHLTLYYWEYWGPGVQRTKDLMPILTNSPSNAWAR